MRELLVYGEIGRWAYDASADGVRFAMQDAGPGGAIRVRVHSPGGSPFEATAMRALLEQHDGPVQIIVDGLAASAAAQLLATDGADVVFAVPEAMVMIHRTWSGASGDTDAMAAEAALLEKIDRATAAMFARRTGKSTDEILELMRQETWFTAQEAIAFGFGSRILGQAPAARGAQQRFRLDMFQRVPDGALKNWTLRQTACEGNRMNLEQLRQRLGLPETATEEQCFQALDARLKANPQAAPTQAATPAPALDADALETRIVQRVTDALVARDTQREASQAHRDAVNAAVENAISAGKVRPAERSQAIAACGDNATQLGATVAYWDAAPRLVPEPLQLRQPAAPGAGAQRGLTQQQLDMCTAAGVAPERFQAVSQSLAAGPIRIDHTKQRRQEAAR